MNTKQKHPELNNGEDPTNASRVLEEAIGILDTSSDERMVHNEGTINSIKASLSRLTADERSIVTNLLKQKRSNLDTNEQRRMEIVIVLTKLVNDLLGTT
jgi:hypothetical protein